MVQPMFLGLVKISNTFDILCGIDKVGGFCELHLVSMPLIGMRLILAGKNVGGR